MGTSADFLKENIWNYSASVLFFRSYFSLHFQFYFNTLYSQVHVSYYAFTVS